MMTTCRYLVIASLIASGCGLETQGKDQCAVQADCLDGFVCNASGTCEPDPGPQSCVPITCGANQCDSIDDQCGGAIDCGECTAPEICGQGAPNQCGKPPDTCIPETDGQLCAAAGLVECGTTHVVDRCGASRAVDCGSCSGAAQCGALSNGRCDEMVCTSSNWCRALGGTLAGELSIRDISGNGQGQVWAAASNSSASGKVLRFDGVRWFTHASGAYEVDSVADAGTLWCASEQGDLLNAADGAFVPRAATNQTWTAMHALSATDIWVVGQWGSGSGAYARAGHFDGEVWNVTNLESSFVDSGWYLLGVSAAAWNKVWAVGAAVGNGSVTDLPPGPLVASYDGVSWTIARTLPSSHYLRAVWAASATDVWAVGDAGTILHFNGTDWSSSPSGVTQHLYAVTGVGTTLWAAGAGGTILKKVGAGAWTTEQSGTSRTILTLWAHSATDVWAGGEGGLLLRYQP